MEKVFAVKKVGTKLIATERAVDAAMAEAAELMADMMRCTSDLGISTKLADPAVAKAMEAMAALSAARTALVGCHEELAEARLRLGVRTRMAGFPTDTTNPMASADEDLRQVG